MKLENLKIEVEQSLGATELPAFAMQTSSKELLCEICGTIHSEKSPDDVPHGFIEILGKQVVLECCGAILDNLFQQFGSTFTEIYFQKFSENPTGKRFRSLAYILGDRFQEIKEKLEENGERIGDLQGLFDIVKAMKIKK